MSRPFRYAVAGSLLLALTVGCGGQAGGLRSHVTRSGQVSQPERWSGTPVLQGDVVIPPGVTVTVAPGTNINFADTSAWDAGARARTDSTERLTHPDLVDIVVRGDFRVDAPEEAGVYIGTRPSPGPFAWGSLIFLGTNERSVIRHAEIKQGKGSVVFADSSRARLESSLLALGGINVRVFDQARPTIRDNRLTNAFAGIFAYHASRPAVRNNRLDTLTQGLVATDRSRPVFAGNRIRSAHIGILAEGRARPVIKNNTVTGSAIGLAVRGSARPELSGNRLAGNDRAREGINAAAPTGP